MHRFAKYAVKLCRAPVLTMIAVATFSTLSFQSEAIYSAIIRGFCNVGKACPLSECRTAESNSFALQVEEALSYLESMLQCKLHPDAMLFDVLSLACIKGL